MEGQNQNLVLQKDKNSYKYVRTCADENFELANKLKACYECKGVEIASSGMNAISTLLHTVMIANAGKKINVVYADELYCDTPRLILYLKKVYNYTTNVFSMINHETELLQYTNTDTDINILFAESCSNPNGIIINYDILNKLKETGKWLIIIDNTWLTHCIQNPLSYPCVDYVVLSLTKYYSGGNCICGAILTNGDIDSVNEYIRVNGAHVSPVNVKKVSDNIDTIGQRLSNSSKTTVLLLNELIKNNKITINHPYVSQKNAHFLNGLYPSVLTINIKDVSKNKVVKTLSDSQIEYKTSFGDRKSRFDPYPSRENDNSITIRLSIGYEEDFDTLYTEVQKVINKLCGEDNKDKKMVMINKKSHIK